MQHPDGITLRQLLAVVAVASVTAVLLGPVLVQAGQSSDRDTSLSKFGLIAKATLAYAADHDGLLPLSAGTNEVIGILRWGDKHRVPAGWDRSGVYGTEERISEDSQIWANSVLPYFPARVGQPYEQPGLPTYQLPNVNYGEQDARLTRLKVGVAYNGLLHAWPTFAVFDPKRLPLYSGMVYRQNLDGIAMSNPTLFCPYPGPCKFNADQIPQRGSEEVYGSNWLFVGDRANFTVWIYDGGMNFASVSGSAYWRKMDAPKWPRRAFNVNTTPWSSFDPGEPGFPPGSPYWMTECGAPGRTISSKSARYAGYFRPDSEFRWTPSECDFGGGP